MVIDHNLCMRGLRVQIEWCLIRELRLSHVISSKLLLMQYNFILTRTQNGDNALVLSDWAQNSWTSWMVRHKNLMYHNNLWSISTHRVSFRHTLAKVATNKISFQNLEMVTMIEIGRLSFSDRVAMRLSKANKCEDFVGYYSAFWIYLRAVCFDRHVLIIRCLTHFIW